MVCTTLVHLCPKDLAKDMEKLRANLIEASQVSKGQKTGSWFVVEGHHDARAFSIIEQYKQESVSECSQCLLS